MDIEKLIEQLRSEAATFRPDSFAQTMLLEAATALSSMKKYCDSVCGHLNEAETINRKLQAENEKLRAELEQVNRENETLKDALQNWHEEV